jgi:hypothetical protein
MAAYDRLSSPYRPPRRTLGERWKYKVRVSSEFLKAVAFLCVDNVKGKREAAGTAFFVSVPDGPDLYAGEGAELTSDGTFNYVVTARHCIEDNIGDPPIYVRINNAVGGYTDMTTHKGDWFTHRNADVALMLLTEPPTNAALEGVPLRIFVGSEYKLVVDFEGLGMDRRRAGAFERGYPDGMPIELGDDLFFPGLFAQSAGKQANLPIVRFGNIARMPTEELIVLRSPIWGDIPVRAYLAECHSWSGHSGSPVFWHHDMKIPESFWIRGLLGLVSAHFDVKRRGRARTNEKVMQLNSGIAVITPANDIRELLMRPDVVDQREDEKRKREQDEPVATVDSAITHRTETSGANRRNRDVSVPPVSRAKFFDDLTKATKRKNR